MIEETLPRPDWRVEIVWDAREEPRKIHHVVACRKHRAGWAFWEKMELAEARKLFTAEELKRAGVPEDSK